LAAPTEKPAQEAPAKIALVAIHVQFDGQTLWMPTFAANVLPRTFALRERSLNGDLHTCA